MSRSKSMKSKNPRTERADAIRKAMEHFHAGIDALAAALDAAQAPVADTIQREVMKPSDYADYMRVNVRKVHSWVKKGMPHFMLEGRVRIRVKQADAWLASRPDSPDNGKKKA